MLSLADFASPRESCLSLIILHPPFHSLNLLENLNGQSNSKILAPFLHLLAVCANSFFSKLISTRVPPPRFSAEVFPIPITKMRYAGMS